MKKNMINRIVIGLMTASLLALTGCGSSGQDAQEAVTSGSSATQATDDKVAHIGFTGTGNNWNGGAVGIAQLNGYFEEELGKLGYAVDMQGFAGLGPAMNEALAAKELDYAFYMEIPGLTATSKGFDLSVVATTSISSGSYLIASKASGITSLEDLKGKKIGYTRGTVYHTFLINALSSVGLTVDDVELVNLSANDMISSILTGTIDAASLTSSNALKLVTEYDAAVTIATSRDRDEWAGLGIIVARNEFINENDGVTEAIIRAIIRGKQDIIADPEGFYEISAEKGNLTVENVKTLYPAGDDGQFDIFPIETTDLAVEILNRTNTLMYENELIGVPVDIDSWVDNSYYERAVGE